MLTIPQFLEFPTTEDTSALVSFFLKLLEHKTKDSSSTASRLPTTLSAPQSRWGFPVGSGCYQNRSTPSRHRHGFRTEHHSCQISLFQRQRTGCVPASLPGRRQYDGKYPGFGHIMKMVLHHHEHWDGSGYPKRLKGVNIPLGPASLPSVTIMIGAASPAPITGSGRALSRQQGFVTFPGSILIPMSSKPSLTRLRKTI